MKCEVQKFYRDHGFGFPVILLNVPVITVRGEKVPDVNQRKLQVRVAEALALKPSRLTGNEVHFIRLYFGLTLVQFAERFNVTHPAVLKWERAENRATNMSWMTEKDLRLFALAKTEPRAQSFVDAYNQLVRVAPERTEAIRIDWNQKPA